MSFTIQRNMFIQFVISSVGWAMAWVSNVPEVAAVRCVTDFMNNG
jgi:hypothetical protein